MKIKPLRDIVIIKPSELENKTDSGIILSDTVERKSDRGTVYAIGKDVKDIKVGDCVFVKIMFNEIEIDKEKYIIAKESEIFAIIKDEN